eukprot:12182466-Heterocapsa_arctica.AAC.1
MSEPSAGTSRLPRLGPRHAPRPCHQSCSTTGCSRRSPRPGRPWSPDPPRLQLFSMTLPHS